MLDLFCHFLDLFLYSLSSLLYLLSFLHQLGNLRLQHPIYLLIHTLNGLVSLLSSQHLFFKLLLLVLNEFLSLLQLLRSLLKFTLHSQEINDVFGSPRLIVLANHLHLLDLDLKPRLDRSQLMLQLLYVLLPVEFHLLHDLFLRVDFTL